MSVSINTTGGSVRFNNESFTGGLHSQVKANRIPAACSVHSFRVPYKQDAGSAVATASVPLHGFYGDGTVKFILAWLETANIGAATVVVDLEKGDADPTALASMLSATITLDSGDSALAHVAGTVDPAKEDCDAGDCLMLEVTATAGGGTLGEGLNVIVGIEEHPESD